MKQESKTARAVLAAVAWLRRWGERLWAGAKLAARETANILTDVLVPVMAVLCAMAEALGLPPRVVLALKRAENALFAAGGTADIVNDYVARLEAAAKGKGGEVQ